MMTVEEMIEGTGEMPAIFTEFTLLTRTHANHLFCFFEGNDNEYYVQRIRVFADKLYPLRCGNRAAVLGTHRLIATHREYDKER